MADETTGTPSQETPVVTEPEATTPEPMEEATVETAGKPEYNPEPEPTAAVEPEPEPVTEEPTPEPEPEPSEQQEATDEQPDAVERVVPKADGYKLPEGVPSEMGAIANKLGYTQEQLDGTVKSFAPIMQAMEQKQMEQLKNDGIKHLESWGDQKDHKLGIAQSALRQFDPDGKMIEALNQTGFRHSPVVMDFLYRVGAGAQEGGFLSTASQNPGKKTMANSFFPSMKQA